MPKYKIRISQIWSEEMIITAKTALEAKKKAWKRYKPKKKNYIIDAEKEPNNYY